MHAPGAMRAVCIVCVGGGVEAGDGWRSFGLVFGWVIDVGEE